MIDPNVSSLKYKIKLLSKKIAKGNSSTKEKIEYQDLMKLLKESGRIDAEYRRRFGN